MPGYSGNLNEQIHYAPQESERSVFNTWHAQHVWSVRQSIMYIIDISFWVFHNGCTGELQHCATQNSEKEPVPLSLVLCAVLAVPIMK